MCVLTFKTSPDLGTVAMGPIRPGSVISEFASNLGKKISI
jgi:hypothetical protein